jgi:hypothetical protein
VITGIAIGVAVVVAGVLAVMTAAVLRPGRGPDWLRHLTGRPCLHPVTGHKHIPGSRWARDCVWFPYAQVRRCLRPGRCHQPAPRITPAAYLGNAELAAHIRVVHGKPCDLTEADVITGPRWSYRQAAIQDHNAQHRLYPGGIPVPHDHLEPGWLQQPPEDRRS